MGSVAISFDDDPGKSDESGAVDGSLVRAEFQRAVALGGGASILGADDDEEDEGNSGDHGDDDDGEDADDGSGIRRSGAAW